MNEFDEQMKRFFEHFKDSVSIEDETEARMMKRFKTRKNAIRRRKIFVLSVSLALAFLIAMSSFVPVFGKNGTLPQLISGISLEKSATTFSGTIEAQSEVLNEIKAKGLSTSDSIIILALLEKTDKPVDKIIEMRASGLGWGKILSDVGISLSTVQQTLEQASIQVKDQIRTQDQIKDQNQTREQEQVSEGNQGGSRNQGVSSSSSNTILVIKGKIENVNGNIITVTGTPILITEQTIIRDSSKLLKITDLEAGEDALVHAVKDNGTITATTIQLFNKNNQNKGNEKNFFVINGIVTDITFNPNTLTIDNTVVVVTADTEIKSKGKTVDFTLINGGDRVVAKVHSSDTTTIADEITVTGNNANEESEEEKNDESGGQENKPVGQTKEYELRSTVVFFDGATLRIRDFENNIVINQDTKIEQEGSGRVDANAIQINDILQIHIRYDGVQYYATNIVILIAPEHKNETFQGEVQVIDLTNKVILLKGLTETFIITDSTKSNKNLTEIEPGNMVEIVGTRVDTNTINIQNINVIKRGNNANPGNSDNNPGQGNGGKH